MRRNIARLRALWIKYLDRDVNEAEADELSQAIVENPKFRRECAESTKIHSMLQKIGERHMRKPQKDPDLPDQARKRARPLPKGEGRK